jgi:hypothetical protein
MTSRLYVVVRADLPPAQQAVQACHAALALAESGVSTVPDTLVLLNAPDEPALLDLAARIEAACALPRGYNLQLVVFREPDLGGQATALATDEEPARRLLKSLPLALFREQTHLQIHT